MNILFTYIRKYLQKNKISTILSSISLICASIFFYIVVCLSINTIIGMQDFIVNSIGHYHAIFYNANDDFIRSMQLHKGIEQVNIIEYKNQISFEYFQSNEKDSIYILGIDESTFNELGIKIHEGRFPTNNHEVIISNNSFTDSTVNLDIGQHILLNNESYEIVGITTPIHFEENQNFYAFLTTKDNIGIKNIYLEYKNSNDIQSLTQTIANNFDGQYETFEVNENYSSILKTNPNQFIMFFILVIVGLLITFFGMNVFLIYSCFKNSYANREKHLAILKTIGVTQSQCKRMILYEGLILLLFSLPIGALLGFIFYEVLRNALNQLIYSITIHSFVIGNKYQFILLLITAIYIFTVAYICIQKSNSKIVKQNVSLTLQSNDETKVLKKPYLELDKNQPILIRLLRKNLKQNRSNYNPLVIGVSFICIVFLLVNGFMGYLREGIFFETNDHNYDVEVIIQSEYYPTQLMTRLKTRENTSEVVITEKLYLDCYDTSILNNDYKDLMFIDGPIQFEVLTFDEQIISNIIPTNNLDLSNINQPSAIVINQTYSSSHRYFFEIFDVNQIKELYYNDEMILQEVNLIFTDSLITGTGYKKNPQMIVSKELFNHIYEKTNNKYHEYHVYYKSNDTTSLIRDINQLDYDSIHDVRIINTQETMRNGQLITMLIRIISYGYILLLSVMAILSASCMASINFDYRRKEIMLYRALGLRMKDLMVLTFMELSYYVLKVMAYSWIISQVFNLIWYNVYFKTLGLKYFIPIHSIYGSIIIAISFLIISMAYIYLRIKSLKYSIISKNEMSLM